MNGNELYATALVTGKRQITIPREVCDYLKIEIGNKVIFREKAGKIVFERDEIINQCKAEVDKTFKVNFIMPFDTISDMLSLGQIDHFEGVFKYGENTIRNNGKVIIQKEYTNAPPQVMRIVESVDELIKIKEDLFSTSKI